MSRFKARRCGPFRRVRRVVSAAHVPADGRATRISSRSSRGARVSSPFPIDVRDAVLTIRRRKGMVLDASDPDTRSVGSFFMNPVVTLDDRERIASIAGDAVPGFTDG